MRWFGACSPELQEPENRAPTPVGEQCSWCPELIAEGDDGVLIPHYEGEDDPVRERPIHLECHIRTVIGSVEHQEKRCSCFGGDAVEPHTREAARQAVARWKSLRQPA